MTDTKGFRMQSLDASSARRTAPGLGHGFVTAVREDSDERNVLDRGPHRAMAERLLLGNSFEWRCRSMTNNTLSVAWFFMRVPKGRGALRAGQRSEHGEPDQGRERQLISSNVINQEIIAWVAKARIDDRSNGTHRPPATWKS